MARTNTRFICQKCGQEEIRWLGQCPVCKEWNSFMEVKIPTPPRGKGGQGFAARPAGFESSSPRSSSTLSGGSATGFAARAGAGDGGFAEPIPLAQIGSAESRRLPVEPAEMAQVLGGGLVEGSVVLLGGEPGVGKSTLLTGLALGWVRKGLRVIYVAGEESPAQIRMRAERLGFEAQREAGFLILPEVNLEGLLAVLYDDRRSHSDRPGVIIADSVQTLHSSEIDALPGSVSQIRYCGGVLADFARQTACPVFLVGHVTKTGDLAGPKILEHMVDTVLYFEGSGGAAIRMVRAVKNRFGTTGELAVFEMRSDGLAPVADAGALFLSGRRGVEPGAAVCAVKNGSRIFLVEVQALVSAARYGTPQRVVQGIDSKRVALLAAVLEKRAGLDLAGCDIFVKVTGGGRADDPAADLAILCALASSWREIPIPADTLIQGEVGLTGEVRDVADRRSRLREASRHGFKRVITSAGRGGRRSSGRLEGLALAVASSVEEAVALALQSARAANEEA